MIVTPITSLLPDGDYYITIGDSIFWGQKDFFSGDGSTQDDSIVMLQGFQSNLADGLNDSTFSPDNNMVFKEAVPGDNSNMLLNWRLPDVLARHPDANYAVMLIGTNDAGGTTVTLSGENCSGAACNGTFKGNLQSTIDELNLKGIMPIVVLVPPRFGDNVNAEPYADPLDMASLEANEVNTTIIAAYNRIIKGQDSNPMTGYMLGPDTFDYYLGGGKNRFTLFNDNLHPGALGHAVLAKQIQNIITGETGLPFVAGRYLRKGYHGRRLRASRPSTSRI